MLPALVYFYSIFVASHADAAVGIPTFIVGTLHRLVILLNFFLRYVSQSSEESYAFIYYPLREIKKASHF
jgi:hypothetical protein